MSHVPPFTPDPRLFPFESRWFKSRVGPVHYIDEGVGDPILFLHGNPTWSFLECFRDDFHTAQVHRLDAKHYIQEDAPVEMASAISTFLEVESPDPGPAL